MLGIQYQRMIYTRKWLPNVEYFVYEIDAMRIMDEDNHMATTMHNRERESRHVDHHSRHLEKGSKASIHVTMILRTPPEDHSAHLLYLLHIFFKFILYLSFAYL